MTPCSCLDGTNAHDDHWTVKSSERTKTEVWHIVRHAVILLVMNYAECSKLDTAAVAAKVVGLCLLMI